MLSHNSEHVCKLAIGVTHTVVLVTRIAARRSLCERFKGFQKLQGYPYPGPGCSEAPSDDKYDHATFITTNFTENQSLGNSLSLAYSLVSLKLDIAQMVQAVRKHLWMTNVIMLDNIYSYKFAKKIYIGNSMLLTYILMSLVLDLTQLVLTVWKHHQMTNIIILDNFYHNNFPIKSFPG